MGWKLFAFKYTGKQHYCWVGLIAVFASQLHAEERCSPALARLTSVQGTVEVLQANRVAWHQAVLNESLCGGDEIRSGPLSRAQIRLLQTASESERDGTVMQINERSALKLPEVAQPWWVNLLRGQAHILTRTPKKLTIKTLFCNATVEGTEFLVQADPDDTRVSVYEGQVRVNNSLGSLQVSNGEAAIAEPNKAPRREILIRPRDAVQWALYYPPIIDVTAVPAGPDQALYRQVLDRYQQGRIEDALTALDQLPSARRNADYYDLRAALYLSVGQVEPARQAVSAARKQNLVDPTPDALDAIIALTQNDKSKAGDYAARAIAAGKTSPAAWVADSYVQQSNFKLDAALNSAQQAVKLRPENGLAWARVAELELARGNLQQADKAGDQARTFAPTLARTQTISGFAALTRIDISKANSAFTAAIQRDPADPLPRLGLGLAEIRKGQLAEGRREIEDAANLDPGNALVRSYLGKAYYEEKRNDLAAKELDNAKALDPNDPTPWFYDAIRKQTENRPVEALWDLQKSIELNDNRTVYRSELSLDEDLAARTAGQGRIYRDLGFSQRARLEAWRSISSDPMNFSGHRLLADALQQMPRNEIARASEVLQSQLLQPESIVPLQPQLAETSLAILVGTGPASYSLNEYNSLFNRSGLNFQFDALGGSNDTFADEFVASGRGQRFSGSFGQFHYQTSGFRKNNDLTHNIYNAFGQVALTSNLSVQGEVRRRETQGGDLSLKLDSDGSDERTKLEQTSGRFGANLTINTRQNLLASLVYGQNEEIHDAPIDLSDDPVLRAFSPLQRQIKTGGDGTQLELQHIFRSKYLNTIVGLGYVNEHVSRSGFSDQLFFENGQFNAKSVPLNLPRGEENHFSAYFYSPVQIAKSLTATLGLSYDYFKLTSLGDSSSISERHQVNPKLGLVWTPFKTTVLRFSAFRALKGSFISNQTIEPTQVAGFNQFFDDATGASSTRYGIGLDQKITSRVFAGLEMSWRKVHDPILFDGIGFKDDVHDERLYRAYVYWTPHPQVALGAEYRRELFTRDRSNLNTDARRERLETQYVPIFLTYFRPDNVFMRLAGTFFVQRALFRQSSISFIDNAPVQTISDPQSIGSNFFLLDASIGYRFPKRRGLLSFEIRNLTDQDFRFEDSFQTGSEVPQALPFQPGRSFFGRLNLWFY